MNCACCCVSQSDAAGAEKPPCTDEDAGGETMAGSCDASETATAARQTKPKKLSKKQLLAEQRRKDRVCASLSAVCHKHTGGSQDLWS